MSTPNKFLWVNQNVSNTTCPKVQTILDCISECSSRKNHAAETTHFPRVIIHRLSLFENLNAEDGTNHETLA